uniref:Alpha A protein n=1 Tax=Poa semilatent virus TaxID=12328 RepID=A0A5B9RT41_9VIRU|nr:alpha A protein [Poa semilatent virus]
MASDEIVRNLVSREDVMGNLISTASSSTRSPLHDTLCSHVKTVIDSVEQKAANRKRIDVRRNISSEELQVLINAYPEYAISSSACESGTHSMAACFRFLETEYLLDMVPIRDTFVFDIGGNWFSHMKYRSDRSIHCCCPILSLRDAERLETRMMNMQRFMRGSNDKKSLALEAKYHGILHNAQRKQAAFAAHEVDAHTLDGDVFCENTFQECVQKVPEGFLSTAISVHSIYDIKIEEFAQGLRNKNIRQAYGCFLFPPALLIGVAEGVMPSVNGHYKVVDGKIKFYFANDPNAGYTHDLKDYLKYVELTFIEIKDGIFQVELLQMRGDTMFFKMTDVTVGAHHLFYRNFRGDENFKCVPMLKNTSVVVPLFSWSKGELSVETGFLPRTLVEQGASYIMKNKEKDLNVAVLKNYLSSVNNSYIFNGSQVREGVKVAPDLLSKLAVTLYLREKVCRRRENKVVEHFEHELLRDPGLGDLFSSLVWFVPEKIKNAWENFRKALLRWYGMEFDVSVFDICDPPLCVEIEDRYRMRKKLGVFSVGEYFDCHDECAAYERREQEKKDFAKAMVDKVVGATEPKASQAQVTANPELKKLLAYLVLTQAACLRSKKEPLTADQPALAISGPSGSDSTPTVSVATSPTWSAKSGFENLPPTLIGDEYAHTWEIANEPHLAFKKVTADLSQRSKMPPRPIEVADYDYNSRSEFLYYLLCNVIGDRAQILEIIQAFRSSLIFTEKVVAPLNGKIFSYKDGNAKWIFREPTAADTGHAYAVHFDFYGDEQDIEKCLSYCTMVSIHWDRSDKYVAKIPFFPSKTGYYVICDNTKLCNNWLIYNILVDVFRDYKPRPIRFELVDGVPGCGKSTMILNTCDLHREAVIGEGRNAMDDLRNKFQKKKLVSKKLSLSRVRTMDSLLLADKDNVPKCQKFHFDEALKVHYGAILFCADRLGATEIIAQGDRAQLPMICRVEGIDLHYTRPDFSRIVISPKLLSYRIPGDVAFYLSARGYYKVNGVAQTITTKNKVERSMFARGETTPERFISLLDVPVRRDVQYLCFMQAEKESLIAHLVPKGVKKESIATIHESQGGTFDHVILVRLQRTPQEIYPGGLRSASYMVVAVSRHTKTFTYCSVVDDKLFIDIADENGIATTPVRTFQSHIVE